MTTARPRWVGAPAQIVFEDTHIRVMFKPGGSDMLLVTFGNADNLARGTRFYADTVAQKRGFNCLGFMAHAANWFPADSMRQAALAASYTLKSFDIRMAYASSLGAYAALKHSASLGITHAVAFCPQWSIDPAECVTQDSGFRDLYRPEMAGMGIRPQDLAGNITIFFDPGAPSDAYHTRMIRSVAQRNPACRVQTCHVHHVAHHVAPVLRGSVLAADIMDACARSQTDRLAALINPFRRASPQRRRNVLIAAAERHPGLALRGLRALGQAGQVAALDGSDCRTRLYRALRKSRNPGSADDVVSVLMPHVSPARAMLLRDPMDSAMPTALLMSVHGTVLCYSALDRSLVHGPWPAHGGSIPGLRPVFLDKTGRLALSIDGRTFFCRSLDHLVTEPVREPDAMAGPCFEARPTGSSTFTFVAAERYLTALPDGNVYRIEATASTWELFSVTGQLPPNHVETCS